MTSSNSVGGDQRTINTGGGDYIGGNQDKRQGAFLEGNNQQVTGVVGQVTGGTIHFNINQNHKPEKPPPPDDRGPLLHNYVDRCDIEDKLKVALTQELGTPVTLLYGMSGFGKSSLAAQVVKQLRNDKLFDSVLWGNLDNLAPDDLLLQFLGKLNREWYHQPPRRDMPLRDIFWNELIDRKARVLVVLDHVGNGRQLADILPATYEKLDHCHILAISTQNLPLSGITSHLEVMGFTPDQALTLFEKSWSKQRVEQYSGILREISQRLEYVPQLLAMAARDFAHTKQSPNTYVRALRKGEGQDRLIDRVLFDSVELVIRELPPEQQDLFEFIGILSEGNWSVAMLAAIALRPLADVRHDLLAFAERDLIKPADTDRYRANRLIRQCALQRLDRKPAYIKQAAYTLLARYYLDTAQDLATRLSARLALQSPAGQAASRYEETFIRAFRDGLRPETTHIRRFTTGHILR